MFWGDDDGNTPSVSYLFWVLMFTGPESESGGALKIFDDMVANKTLIVGDYTKENFSNFMGWHGNSTDATGTPLYIVSRLIQSENLATPEARKSLTDATVVTKNGSFNFIGGKGVMDADPDGT